MSRRGARPKPAAAAVVRCAIYTRKSSEEGLEQDFNSLDAQREACEAYVLSQKGAGWIALPTMYDDGGVSGGTLERPALQRMLADIEDGRIDTVVVYKVDRLTRSLSDFAKIVDTFDAKAVAFVSVTQQFNTTTSMGRLTLNMLLSFAQFEREVTGERIRDKIAASKKKGIWMGGYPPLGYDVRDRKLVVNATEAETVRHIFRRYAELKSVRTLAEDLDAARIVSKISAGRFGTPRGGKPLTRGALYLMLQNPIYRGKIVHKDKIYPGLHDAIVDEALWNEVGAVLSENRVERVTRSTAIAPSLLTGLVYDASGERMSPTHANKKGTRYRYYVSQSLIKKGRTKSSARACRVPAADLEAIVEECVTVWLRDEASMADAAGPGMTTVEVRKNLIAQAGELSFRWPRLASADKRTILHALVSRIEVHAETVDITVHMGALPGVVGACMTMPAAATPQTSDRPTKVLSVPARVRRTGLETRLLIPQHSRSPRREPDHSLLRLLGQARRFHNLIVRGEVATITALANRVGVTTSYVTRVFRLSFLAPQITKAILDGRQPPELTANKLAHIGGLDAAWPAQRRQLGLE